MSKICLLWTVVDGKFLIIGYWNKPCKAKLLDLKAISKAILNFKFYLELKEQVNLLNTPNKLNMMLYRLVIVG